MESVMERELTLWPPAIFDTLPRVLDSLSRFVSRSCDPCARWLRGDALRRNTKAATSNLDRLELDADPRYINRKSILGS